MLLQSAFEETVKLFHRLRAATNQLHGLGVLSGGLRGILRDVDQLGPQTVPQLARLRPVSRQHIQSLVNQLLAGGYVELVENPAHKRSHLVRPTPAAKELIEPMTRRETALLAQLSVGIAEEDLRTAVEVLCHLRELLGSPEARRLLDAERSEPS